MPFSASSNTTQLTEYADGHLVEETCICGIGSDRGLRTSGATLYIDQYSAEQFASLYKTANGLIFDFDKNRLVVETEKESQVVNAHAISLLTLDSSVIKVEAAFTGVDRMRTVQRNTSSGCFRLQ